MHAPCVSHTHAHMCTSWCHRFWACIFQGNMDTVNFVACWMWVWICIYVYHLHFFIFAIGGSSVRSVSSAAPTISTTVLWQFRYTDRMHFRPYYRWHDESFAEHFSNCIQCRKMGKKKIISVAIWLFPRTFVIRTLCLFCMGWTAVELIKEVLFNITPPAAVGQCWQKHLFKSQVMAA